MRHELIETLDLTRTPVRSILERLEEERFTGYIEVSMWNSKEYLLLYKGALQRAIVAAEDSLEHVSPDKYTLPISGTARIFKTDIFSLLNALKNCNETGITNPICFAGYGNEKEVDIPLRSVTLTQLIDRARALSLDGYILLHTENGITGLVLTFKGIPVNVFSGKATGEEALKGIISTSSHGKASLFSLKEEVLKVLASADSVTTIREGKLSSLTQLQAVEDDIKSRKITGFLVLEKSSHEHYYELFLRGDSIALIHRTLFFIGDIKHEDISFETKFSLHAVRLKEPLNTMNMDISITETSQRKLTPEKVQSIKELFVEEMGPAGIPVWNRVLRELGCKETSIPADSFQTLIEQLAKEIPYDEYRQEFLKKVRRFAP